MSGSSELRMIDSRDYALIVTVDKRGCADMHADGVEKAQAAEWLRLLAERFTEATGGPAASCAAHEIGDLRRIVRRLANHEPIDDDLIDLFKSVVEGGQS